jgi:RNA recognition motif-containing protein
MNNKVYVGNLSWGTSQDGLTQFFSQFGKVTESFVAVDKMSGRSKGFGFVTFATDEDAANACAKANGAELDGRKLKVDIARPMEERPAGERRGGNGGGYGNNRGGDRRDRY